MACRGSPTTKRSRPSPSHALSRRHWAGLTSWNSSTKTWRMRHRWAAATTSSSSSSDAHRVTRSSRSSTSRRFFSLEVARRRPRPRSSWETSARRVAAGDARRGRVVLGTQHAHLRPVQLPEQHGSDVPRVRRATAPSTARTRRSGIVHDPGRAQHPGRPSGDEAGRGPWRGTSPPTPGRALRAEPVGRAARRDALRVKVTTSVCSARRRPVEDAPGHPSRQDRRLARAGRGQDAQRGVGRTARPAVGRRSDRAAAPTSRRRGTWSWAPGRRYRRGVSGRGMGGGPGPGGSLPGVLRSLAGGVLYGETWGEGPPAVVALHGWRRTHADFAASLGPLAAPRATLPTLAPDLPGFGATPAPARAVGIGRVRGGGGAARSRRAQGGGPRAAGRRRALARGPGRGAPGGGPARARGRARC